MLKYESFYLINMMDHLTTLKEIQHKFREAKASLGRKKSKMWDEGHPEKWETDGNKFDRKDKTAAMDAMLPKETRKLAKMRDVYALYSTAIGGELERYYRCKNKELGEQFVQWCHQETRLCSEMMMLWVDAETNLMSMAENKAVRVC